MESSILMDDSTAFNFALIAAIGNLATAAALGFLWFQSYQTQKQTKLTQQQTKLAQEQMNLMQREMENTLRPWIGVADVEIKAEDLVTLQVKNYGRIPGRVVKMKAVFDEKKISKDLLYSTDAKNYETMVFPDSIYQMSSFVPEGLDFHYMAVMIEYEYANNKRGDYALIARRVAKTATVIYEEVFAH